MKEYLIRDIQITERVSEHIWEKHRIYMWQIYDVIDDPDTIYNERTDRKHGNVLVARGMDRGGAPLILFMSLVDREKGILRLRTARRPDRNEYKRFFE